MVYNYHPLLKRSTSARLSSLPTSQETTDLYWKPYWNDESTLNCLVTEQHKLPVLPVLLVPCQVQTPFTLTAGEIVVVSFKEEIVVPWPPLPSWCPHKSCEVQSPKNRKNRCAWKICGSLGIWSSRYHSDPNKLDPVGYQEACLVREHWSFGRLDPLTLVIPCHGTRVPSEKLWLSMSRTHQDSSGLIRTPEFSYVFNNCFHLNSKNGPNIVPSATFSNHLPDSAYWDSCVILQWSTPCWATFLRPVA